MKSEMQVLRFYLVGQNNVYLDMHLGQEKSDCLSFRKTQRKMN